MMLGCLAVAVPAACFGCSGVNYGPYPRDRWLYGREQGWFIFSTWTGVTAERTVYDYDNHPIGVAVLEQVQGPPAYESAEPPAPTIARNTPTLWLTNATEFFLTTDVVPAGLNVRVDGFVRPQHQSGIVRNARTGHYNVAGEEPGAHGGRPSKMFTARMIQVRRIVQLLPDGSERIVWKTDVPFRGL